MQPILEELRTIRNHTLHPHTSNIQNSHTHHSMVVAPDVSLHGRSTRRLGFDPVGEPHVSDSEPGSPQSEAALELFSVPHHPDGVGIPSMDVVHVALQAASVSNTLVERQIRTTQSTAILDTSSAVTTPHSPTETLLPAITSESPHPLMSQNGLDHAELFDGIDADAFDHVELSPPIRRLALASQSNHVVSEAPQAPEPARIASFLHPSFAGFKTGHGKHVKPSERALQVARKLMLDLEQSQDVLPSVRAVQSSSRELPSGLDSGGLNPTSMVDRLPMAQIPPRQGANVVSGRSEHSPKLVPKLGSIHVVSAAQTRGMRPAERTADATPQPIPSAVFSEAFKLSSPRTPVVGLSSRFSTPQSGKRISLGMMPRGEIGAKSVGSKRSLPKFVTPFKRGKRPRIQVHQHPASPIRTHNNSPNHLSTPSPVPNRIYPPTRNTKTNPLEARTVFRLQSNQPRQKLCDMPKPEHYSALQMIAKGVPDEVIVILNDASRAAQYAFEAPDGGLLMQRHALEELHSLGCTHAQLGWVQNHWTLILWKLAGLVRLQPNSAHERWSWNELMRQLLYRYEREVNLAQRSCVKRIQERDSSPARPMVLFVSSIFQDESEVQHKDGSITLRTITVLELSDGWYRIQAHIDAVLTAACRRGRLSIGQKLAIMGATLDTHAEGIEVLSAYHISTLILASNSVSLAPWHARLGFAPTPFFASLRSLTSEGGLVSLMDVVITKVYPLAYVDVDRSTSKAGIARGEEEEAEERELWTKRRQDAIQQFELHIESHNRRVYDLVQTLCEIEGDAFLPCLPEDPSGKLEAMAGEILDRLMARTNPACAVGELVTSVGCSGLVPWLVALAKGRVVGGEGGVGELDRICPPRKVREFRVVRFRDARLPPPPPPPPVSTVVSGGGNGGRKNPYARTVQLTVWDSAQLGEELQEGRRFLVTNLVPLSKSAWRKPDEVAEVFLSTRRDTKWRPLP